MNGVHDMGGLDCFGPVNSTPDDLFHAGWEKDVLALTLAMGATGSWNLDQSRAARESLPPSDYLSLSYYRIWLAALEKLLLTHQLVSQEELNQCKVIDPPKAIKRVLSAVDVATVLAKGAPVSRPTNSDAAFNIGDRVIVKNRHSTSHTRLPAYIRNRTGIIHHIHGTHVYPDSHAQDKGEDPKWLYNVRFDADELWGESGAHALAVHVDCWEPYLSAINQSNEEAT